MNELEETTLKHVLSQIDEVNRIIRFAKEEFRKDESIMPIAERLLEVDKWINAMIDSNHKE